MTTYAPPAPTPESGAMPDTADDRVQAKPVGRPSSTPIWRRDFALLWGGSAVSQLGTIGAAAASPLLALSLTHSPVVAGWVSAASTAPGLLLHLPAGVLVDRYDRRRIMLFSQLIRAVSASLLFLGLFTINQPRGHLMIALGIAAAIDGSCAVFYRIAEVAAVQYIVPSKQIAAAMGKNEARQHMALVFGRPMGGLLFAVHRSFPYGVDAISSFLSLISLFLLKTKRLQPFRTRRERPKDTPRVTIREGVKQLFTDRFIGVTVVACAITNFAFQAIILLLVVQAEKDLSSSAIGALLAVSGLSGFIGAIIAPRVVRKYGSERTVICCVALWVPLIAIVAVSDHPIVGMISWGLCSGMGAQINVALAAHQARSIPIHRLGRVEGINKFLTTGMVTFGALSGGYFINFVGPRTTAFLAAMTFGFTAIAVALLVPRPPRPLAQTGRLSGDSTHRVSRQCPDCREPTSVWPLSQATFPPDVERRLYRTPDTYYLWDECLLTHSGRPVAVVG